ncbi:MAG: sulfite exporter TauE/SafE family protein [Actinobacteria bacterium]|nr:sulfite exporter TauE/SafE family protein [Actinomycetota bacterium]
MDPITLIWLACAGFAAGAINAAVGSGTLITYPALIAVGIPPIAANGTNSAGLSPGSFASAWAYRTELRDRMVRLRWPLVASVVGAAIGAMLVVSLPSRVFVAIVPWLVGAATVLIAVQPILVREIGEHRSRGTHSVWPWTGLIGVYGGYFGAAQGVMLMAALGLVYDSDTQRSNGAKNILASVANITAAVVFALHGEVVWLAAVAVAFGSIPGGYVGGRVARRLPGQVLRGLVVLIGIGATLYLILHH